MNAKSEHVQKILRLADGAGERFRACELEQFQRHLPRRRAELTIEIVQVFLS